VPFYLYVLKIYQEISLTIYHIIYQFMQKIEMISILLNILKRPMNLLTQPETKPTFFYIAMQVFLEVPLSW